MMMSDEAFSASTSVDMSGEIRSTRKAEDPEGKLESSMKTVKDEDDTDDVSTTGAEFPRVLQDSTHSFLYQKTITSDDGEEREVTLPERIIAFLVVFFQFFVYIWVAVFLQVQKIEYDIDEELDSAFSNLNEEQTAENFAKISAVSMITLLIFLLPDLSAATVLFDYGGFFKFNRVTLTAWVLLLEFFVGLVAGFFFVGFAESMIDAFLGCVGIAFVHDIDEKVRQSMDQGIGNKRKWIGLLTLCLFPIVIVVANKFYV